MDPSPPNWEGSSFQLHQNPSVYERGYAGLYRGLQAEREQTHTQSEMQSIRFCAE